MDTAAGAGTPVPEGWRVAMETGLAEAVFSRRSRRFGLGMTLPEGPMAFTSRHDPVPLTELEEALLVWLGTGTTGLALGDLPPTGLAWMQGWDGRSWPCSCNSHSTELFYANDDGLWMVALRDDVQEGPSATPLAGLTPEAALGELLARFRARRVRLEEGRPDLPTGEPGLFRFNAWNAGRPGTTLFVPVTDTTYEYLTLLFIYFDEEHRFTVIDEHAGGHTCGLDPWLATGRIRRDLTLSLVDLELRVLTTLNVEQAFICQNMALALQTLGLGGWTFTGFLPHHLLGGGPAHRGLGFRFITPERSPRAVVAPVPVGRDGVFETLTPPYVADMEEAVDRYLAQEAEAAGREGAHGNPSEVAAGRARPSEETVAIVKAFCRDVQERHGRFPAFLDPAFARLVVQAHHLDLEFYDEHFHAGAYTDRHRDHMRLWHGDPGAA
jgi:hypothetical protein